MTRGLLSIASFTTLATVLSCFLGCGESIGPNGSVSGTAKMKGENLKAGTQLIFTGEKGAIATGTVAEDGTYVLKIIGAASPEKIPAGNYKVAVTPSTAGAAMSDAEYEAMMNSGGKPPETKKDNSIPPKYRSAQTSGLSFEVKTGANTYNIVLE